MQTRIWIQFITLMQMRIRIQLTTLMRMQIRILPFNLMRILVDPDPQHWSVHRWATHWEPRKCLKAVCTVSIAGLTSGLENRGSKGVASS